MLLNMLCPEKWRWKDTFGGVVFSKKECSNRIVGLIRLHSLSHLKLNIYTCTILCFCWKTKIFDVRVFRPLNTNTIAQHFHFTELYKNCCYYLAFLYFCVCWHCLKLVFGIGSNWFGHFFGFFFKSFLSFPI